MNEWLRWTGRLAALVTLGAAGVIAGLAAAPAQAQTEADRLAYEIFEKVNDERAERGLDPVEWDHRMAEVARDWSAHMQASGEFRHRDLGALDDEPWGAAYRSIAENIAMGQTTAGQVHAGWMRSDGHRANILNPDVDRLGVGVVCVGGTMHATQNFAISQTDGQPPAAGDEPPAREGPPPQEPIVHPDDGAGTSCQQEQAGTAADAPERLDLPTWPEGAEAEASIETTAVTATVELPETEGPVAEHVVRTDASQPPAGGVSDVVEVSEDATVELSGLPADSRIALQAVARAEDGLGYDVLDLTVETDELPVGDRDLQRHAGPDRFVTATSVAGPLRDAVVLARGDDPADALAGAPLAAALEAPILLTDGGELSEATELRLDAWREPSEVVVLGGEGAIEDSVLEQVEELTGVTPQRVAGADRLETAVDIGARVLDERDGEEDDETDDAEPLPVWFAEGFDGWPDAIAASAAAAQQQMPLLLTGAEEAPETTIELLEEVRDQVEANDREIAPLVAGGEAVVDDAVLASLDAERVAGQDRYATAAQIRERMLGDEEPDEVWIATLRDWPDSLAVAARAAQPSLGAEEPPVPVFVHGGDGQDRGALEWLARTGPQELNVAGGEAAVADVALKAILDDAVE